MNELETKRKELNNQFEKLDKEDRHYITDILEYISYYDFSKQEVLIIEEDLINIARTSRVNKRKISTKITNQNKYCEDLIKKYNRKELNYIHFLNTLPYDLLIIISLILLLLDGSRNPITNTYAITDVLEVRLSYFVIILSTSMIGITMYLVRKWFVIYQKKYYRYNYLFWFVVPFILRTIYDVPLMNTELFRLNTLNVFMVTIALGIFAIYRWVKENYM